MEQVPLNNGNTTLNGTITSGATSLVVSSATPLPTAGDFRILIDTEIMLVTAVSGTTLTVTRGIEGTTAAAHTTGAIVACILTAAALSRLRTYPPLQTLLGSSVTKTTSNNFNGTPLLLLTQNTTTYSPSSVLRINIAATAFGSGTWKAICYVDGVAIAQYHASTLSSGDQTISFDTLSPTLAAGAHTVAIYVASTGTSLAFDPASTGGCSASIVSQEIPL
jgi:hypothetical protein